MPTDLKSLVELAASVSSWKRSSRGYSFNDSAYEETAYIGLSSAGLLRVSRARSPLIVPKPPAEGLKPEPPYAHERYAVELLAPHVPKNIFDDPRATSQYLLDKDGRVRCYANSSRIKDLYGRVESACAPRSRAAGA